jgi:hypothetical protein
VGKNSIILKNHTDISLAGVNSIDNPISKLDSSSLNAVKPGNHPEESSFTAARRPQKGKKLSLPNSQ